MYLYLHTEAPLHHMLPANILAAVMVVVLQLLRALTWQ